MSVPGGVVSWRRHKLADLSAAETAARRALSEAVYPREAAANWPGRFIEWASPQWFVVCWAEDGQALSQTGVLIREAKADRRPVRLGGIGGVMTHPSARRQGLAANGISRALEFLSEQNVEFALLVCEPALVAFYEKLGWRLYPDTILVTQRGLVRPFTFNLPMIHPVGSDGSAAGTIDLLGPPW